MSKEVNEERAPRTITDVKEMLSKHSNGEIQRTTPLHMEFHCPLLHSSLTVSDALLWLSQRLSARKKIMIGMRAIMVPAATTRGSDTKVPCRRLMPSVSV